METQGINFDVRQQGQPIGFAGSTSDVSEGCEVYLKADGAQICAKVVKTNADQTFEGEVTGFPGSDLDELGDLNIGSPIRFQDRHIFRCAA